MQKACQYRSIDQQDGLTQIKVLVTITTLAVVLFFILAGFNWRPGCNNLSVTKTVISNLATALDQYFKDSGHYPGDGYEAGNNAFPALFEALYGEPVRNRREPYIQFKEDDLLVFDLTVDLFRTATVEEIYDSKIKKYIADPFGEPYVYRLTRSWPERQRRFGALKFLVFSCGPDKTDQTSDPGAGESDDIGNW